MSVADVLVVGAGPAGSAAAASLAARGWRVILADRAVFPRSKPCGDYCNPGAVETLRSLGLLPALERSGAGSIDGMTVVGQDGSTMRGRFPSGRGVLLRRETLDMLLLRRAEQKGAHLVERFRVDEIGVADSVEVRDTLSGRALRARLLIAADGMRSAVARRLGLLRGLPDGRFTAGAYFSGVSGPPEGELHLGDGLYGGVARFGDGTANVCLALPRTLYRGRSAAEAFALGLRGLPVLGETVSGWRPLSPFRVTGPIGFARRAVSAAGVLLAGDAAGQVEPLTGQGIAAALRSGLDAAEEAHRALETGDLSAISLHRYDRRRAAAFGPAVRMMKVVTALALRPGLTPLLLRRLSTRPGLFRCLLGAAGNVLDPDVVLSPGYAVRLLLGFDAHQA